ncbi:Vesicle transport protein [Entamoeba marina]
MTEEAENLTQQTQDTNRHQPSSTIEGIINDVKRVVSVVFNEFGNTYLNFNPLVLCLIATCGSFVGGLLILLTKHNYPTPRAYGIQSFMVNGCLFYGLVVLFVASFFSDIIFWFFLIDLMIVIVAYVAQIVMAIRGKGEKFYGVPYISTWIEGEAVEGNILPTN